MSATPTVPPPPAKVRLSPGDHAKLIISMERARHESATAVEQQLGRVAKAALITAYAPWIRARSSFGAPNRQAADARFSEALLRVNLAVDRYDYRSGVPLASYLTSHHTVSGEAVATAGLPLVPSTQRGRRSAKRSEQPAETVASLDAELVSAEGQTLGSQFPDSRPGPVEIVELEDLRKDVRARTEELPAVHRDILTATFGLGGALPLTLTAYAASTGVRVAAASRRLSRAQAALAAAAPQLRRYLED